MARTKLTVNRVTRTVGKKWTTAGLGAGDATNGNYADNDGAILVIGYNAHATLARTVTFVTPETVDGGAVADLAQSLAALEYGIFGPFPPGIYGQQLMIDPQTTDIKLQVVSYLPEVRE